MTNRFAWILAAAALATVLALAQAQQKSGSAPQHPDLSGVWAYAVDQPPLGVRQVIDGKVTVGLPDLTGRQAAREEVPGALPFQDEPSYKPELQAKVKELDAQQSRTDSVFYCGRPGVPRLGPPRKIVQLPKETIFLYEDMSGDTWRIIPTDGPTGAPKHDPDLDPSYNGDAIGWWDGGQFVVESVNFVEDTWFGELGYFHSGQMKVIERLWLDGGKLAYQVTVDDPGVLTRPWTMAPHLIKPSDMALQESPVCVDFDGPRLKNDDHHAQR